jgi:DNA-binding transcriptional regulator YhcF (GntR family)
MTKEQAASALDSAIWTLLELGVDEDEIREWIDNAFEDAVR